MAEKKLAKEVWRESREIYRDIFEQSPMGISIATLNGRVVAANKAMQAVTGYSLGELKKINPADTYENIEDRNVLLEAINQYGSVIDFPVRLKRKDGTSYDALLSISRTNLRGKDFLHIICHDVTVQKRVEVALRESEEKFRYLMETSPECAYSAFPDGEILYMSPTAKSIFGYSPEEFQKDKNLWMRLIHEDDQKELLVAVEKLLKEGVPYIRDFRMRRKDENIVWIRDHANAILDDKGKPIKITGTIYDITERKRMEEKIYTYHDQLYSLLTELLLIEERERRRIASDLHDHIGQTLALSKIKLGMLQKLASSEVSKIADEIRELIEKTIKSARSLIFELSPPVLYEFGVEKAIEWLTEHFQEEYGILFDFENDEQSKPIDDNIRLFLFQAVRELLINVVKHSHARKATVSIQRERDMIRITVDDDGVGFDTSKVNSYVDKPHGFGLFSIRERLKIFGGTLEVKSSLDFGTRATLMTPLMDENKKTGGK